MGRISEEDVARVRDATDIVAFVAETVPLRQKGRLFWGLCPFHGEKTPSFKVDPGTQLWHCFGCGLGGDAFGFLMKTQNLDFPDAVRLLADRARIEIVEEGGAGLPQGRKERLIGASDAAAEYFHKTLSSSKDAGAEAARTYLSKRGFGSDVAKRWRLGYAPSARGALARHLATVGFERDIAVEANLAMVGDGGELKDRFYNRIMFPIADLQGRTIAFGGRVVGQGEPKYLNTAETPIFHKKQNLYAIDRAKNEIVATGTAIVVEGYTDVIALHEAGLRNAVATLGTALSAQHVKLLGRFAKRIVYLFDGDEAGMRAADKAAEYLDFSSTPEAGSARLDLLVAVIPDGRDPADHVGEAGEAGMREVVEGAQPLLRFVLDRRLDGFDLHSPEDRTKALASAASVLASVRGSILAQDYANYVAGRLAVGYEIVAEAMKKAKPAYDGRAAALAAESAEAAPGRASAPVAAARRVPDAEGRMTEELVRQLVAEPALRIQVRDLLAIDGALSDPLTSRLVQAVVNAGSLRGKELYEAVSAADRELGEALSTYLVDAMEPGAAVARFDETLARLTEFALKREVVRLQSAMRSAESVKDSQGYDEMFRKAAELQRRLAELRGGVS